MTRPLSAARLREMWTGGVLMIEDVRALITEVNAARRLLRLYRKYLASPSDNWRIVIEEQIQAAEAKDHRPVPRGRK